jgi:hypothetical protein
VDQWQADLAQFNRLNNQGRTWSSVQALCLSAVPLSA